MADEETSGFSQFTKRFGVLATAVAMVGGALGIANQADIAEPHWIATRSFVRDMVAQANSKIESRQLQTQIYLARSERSRLENELANKQVLLTQNPTMPQEVRRAIEDQIRTLNRDLEAAKSALEDLRREQRRP